MRLPARVRVGPHPYNVRRVPGEQLKHKEDGSPLFGDTDVDTLTIRLCKWMRKSKSQEVLLHEVMHACVDPLEVDPKIEELLISRLAPTLLQAMRDNPEMVKYLLAKQ